MSGKRNTEFSKYLIAGGAGFIGSHLVKYFLSLKETTKVIIIDNFLTGTKENIAEVLNDDRLEIIEADITKEEMLNAINTPIDVIFHLAAIANPTDYENNPIMSLMVNSRGNENLIRLAKRLNTKRYIFFSSSEIYGNYEEIVGNGLDEDSEGHLMLNKQRSPYSIGKCFGEELSIHYSLESDLKYIIIRPFNVFGPNMDLKTHYGRVIPNFIKWGLHGNSLQVNGDGSQIRSFCYINDFVEGIDSLLQKDVFNVTLNLGNPHPISILDLAKLIIKLIDSKQGYTFEEKYKYEPYVRIPNISLMSKLSGWEPNTSLETGLTKTIEWFKNGGLEKYTN